MSKQQFIQELQKQALEQDITLTQDMCERLYEYKELLVEWNEKINLTTITDDMPIITKHFVDSVIATKYIKPGDSVIDVGTGAGFPGIVLAIYFEGKIKTTLLDSLNKRINFLDEVINKLGLKNIQTVHGRAEECAHESKHRERYDVAVARAVAPMNTLSEYTAGYIKAGGKVVFMKAMGIDEEIQESKNAFTILNLKLSKKDRYILRCEDEEMIRCIIECVKEKPLDSKYPRQFAKIKKSPL